MAHLELVALVEEFPWGHTAIKVVRWFLVGFVLLLMAVLFVLLIQPSAVGRDIVQSPRVFAV